ncbi:MAG: nucleotidyl transferase AbiEii/AbiGii toxin family protein [Mariniphaga sp.]|nr:nucleotidyl transferase AbiEii/AbiGii toxin family protein [Mariniphaga sp.]
MQKFYQLPKEDKLKIIEQISARTPLPDYAVEKDWWVVQTLRIIAGMDFAKHILFKGGTSLSKAWKLIDRFSEDIDLALDKAVLGIDTVQTKKQVKQLRSKSKSFITHEFFPLLKKGFVDAGINDTHIFIPETTENDPLSIEIHYPNVTQYSKYIKPRVLIEIGSRSLKEPFTEQTIISFITEQFPEQDFADEPVIIATATPERTFLEKIFLLHEEFQKDEIRTDRLSRHFYDIEKMMDTPFAKEALANHVLYQTIVQHRKFLFSIGAVDYNLHQPQTINLIPPDKHLKEWEKDYTELSVNMIYGDKLSWEKLLERIKELTDRINKLDFTIELD